MLRKSPIGLLLGLALATACGGSQSGTSMPRNVPVPKDAANPIILKFEGASHQDVIDIVTSALSSQGIPTYQVLPEEGLVETRWLDMATWDPTRQSRNIPANERNVELLYRAGKGVDTETGEEYGMGLVAWAYYQPDPGQARVRPRTYREPVPTTHYGYTFLLRVQSVINQKLTQAGIEFEMIRPKSLGG